MDPTTLIHAAGPHLPSPGYLFGMLMFSLIGYVAFRHGRRSERKSAIGIGVALMLFPYVISSTLWLYVVGGLLCAALFVDRS